MWYAYSRTKLRRPTAILAHSQSPDFACVKLFALKLLYLEIPCAFHTPKARITMLYLLYLLPFLKMTFYLYFCDKITSQQLRC